MLVSSEVIKNSGIQFGTSGARGLVDQFSSDVCAAFTHAFLSSLDSVFSFDKVAVAIDNRPSSLAMAKACIRAIESMGFESIYYGVLPTPALAFSSMEDAIPCIMVTGSHIPFDRNGLKFYRPDGEITKDDESSILNATITFESCSDLPDLVINSEASERYVERYTRLFETDFLCGKRIGIYEHSSAGRDLYSDLFKSLGAEVLSLERSDEFVPIDTEAVADSDKKKAKDWSKKYSLDFIFSTDGDGDRPLVADESGEWLRGDILGLLCASEMKIEALAIPVSCNTIIENSSCFLKVSLTKIGSPYVISQFEALSKNYNRVAGFEANGGFLLGSDVEINNTKLKSLPTRDAVLPALMLLSAAKNTSIINLVNSLPQRFTHSDRIQHFPTEASLLIIDEGKRAPQKLIKKLGFLDVSVVNVDTKDGLRMMLSDNSIVHLRPSGNAPEIRCYAEADSTGEAQKIVDTVLARVQLI